MTGWSPVPYCIVREEYPCEENHRREVGEVVAQTNLSKRVVPTVMNTFLPDKFHNIKLL